VNVRSIRTGPIMDNKINYLSALIEAANYRIDVRTFTISEDEAFSCVKYDGTRVTGNIPFYMLSKDARFETVLQEMIGSEEGKIGRRDEAWHAARVKALNRKVGETEG